MEKLTEFFTDGQTMIKFQRIGVDYSINAFTLSDDAWMQSTFGPEQLNKLAKFNPQDKVAVDTLLKIFYRILDDESKRHLRDKVKVFDFDDDGNEKEVEGLSAIDKLKRVISSQTDLIQVFKAIGTARELSNPIVKKLVEDANEKKSRSHGENSPTSSQVNTDTPRENSDS